MQISAIPQKMTLYWGQFAGQSYIRQVPTPSQIGIQNGAASFTDGFPPLTTIAVAAGGVPPYGQDFNGILQQITQWNQWQQVGGPVQYDGTFSSGINGYPKGAAIQSINSNLVWLNLVDNNTTNPDSGGTNWTPLCSAWSASVFVASGSSSNVLTVVLNPAPANLAALVGIPIYIQNPINFTSTGAVTLNPNNLGAISVVNNDGTALSAGSLQPSGIYGLIYTQAGVFQLISRTNVFTDPNVGAITLVGPGSNGANLALKGNGITTPNKFIRVVSGVLQIVNSAYNSVIATLTDGGILTINGNINSSASISAASAVSANQINSSGNVTAVENVQAGVGAFGSGNNNNCTILGDWTAVNSTNGLLRHPNGYIEQWGQASTGGSATTITFPYTFPHACLNVQITNFLGASSGQPPTVWPGAWINGAGSFNALQSSSSANAQAGTIFWRAVGY